MWPLRHCADCGRFVGRREAEVVRCQSCVETPTDPAVIAARDSWIEKLDASIVVLRAHLLAERAQRA